MSVRAKHLSRLGQAQLQEAVLDVLFHAYKKGTSLRPNEISKRAGIYPGTIYGRNQNHIVAGILGTLQEQKKVREVNPIVEGTYPPRQSQVKEWALSKVEYRARSAGSGGSG